MSTRAAWLLCAIIVFGAYGVLAIMTPYLSVPPEISITLPAPELSPKLAGLSGMWESAQDSLAPTRVVVERIDEIRATILLIGRNHPPGYPVRFTLRVAEDGATLESQIERAGAVAQTTLKKVGAFVTVTAPKLEAMLTKVESQPGKEPGR